MGYLCLMVGLVGPVVGHPSYLVEVLLVDLLVVLLVSFLVVGLLVDRLVSCLEMGHLSLVVVLYLVVDLPVVLLVSFLVEVLQLCSQFFLLVHQLSVQTRALHLQ
jgi:hypothetical protein